MQPDQVLRTIKRQGIFTPEILSISAKTRRDRYSRYLNDLLEVNPESFGKASDVQRGFESLASGFQNEVNEEDLTFWVDPLDGSSGLTEGHTEHLTCIIGLAVQNRPLMGIVHKPFTSNNSAKTFLGLPESGLFTITTSSNGGASGSTLASYEPPFCRNSKQEE